jgi:hypothetical protein
VAESAPRQQRNARPMADRSLSEGISHRFDSGGPPKFGGRGGRWGGGGSGTPRGGEGHAVERPRGRLLISAQINVDEWEDDRNTAAGLATQVNPGGATDRVNREWSAGWSECDAFRVKTGGCDRQFDGARHGSSTRQPPPGLRGLRTVWRQSRMSETDWTAQVTEACLTGRAMRRF